MNMNLTTAIEFLVESIKADYRKSVKDERAETEHAKAQISRFDSSFSIQEGRKYFKIVSNGSAWGFIQKESDGKFNAGDILKAASWASPAKNSARGNVLKGGYTISWTGPLYLK